MRFLILLFCSIAVLAQAAEGPVVVTLGDSLTAGHGLEEQQAWPRVAQQLLREAGHPVTIHNAGISGDTTAGGLSRIDWLLKSNPDWVVIALGANDGLRGLPVSDIKTNLSELIARCRKAGAQVALAGIQLPLNYGQEYRAEFAAISPTLAKRHQLPLMPFLLQDVALVPELNQADGVHPTAEGQAIIAKNMAAFLTPLITSAEAAP